MGKRAIMLFVEDPLATCGHLSWVGMVGVVLSSDWECLARHSYEPRAVGQDAAEKNENAWIAVKKRMSKAGPAVEKDLEGTSPSC